MDKQGGAPLIDIYELIKDTLYIFHDQSWVLGAGEYCRYFTHSDTYLFEERDGVVPWFPRIVVEAQPDYFRAATIEPQQLYTPCIPKWGDDILGAATMVVRLQQSRGSKQPLTEDQRGLVATLFVKALNRGAWAKRALETVMKQEILNTSRYMPSNAVKQIDVLLDGIQIEVRVKTQEGTPEKEEGS